MGHHASADSGFSVKYWAIEKSRGGLGNAGKYEFNPLNPCNMTGKIKPNHISGDVKNRFSRAPPEGD